MPDGISICYPRDVSVFNMILLRTFQALITAWSLCCIRAGLITAWSLCCIRVGLITAWSLCCIRVDLLSLESWQSTLPSILLVFVSLIFPIRSYSIPAEATNAEILDASAAISSGPGALPVFRGLIALKRMISTDGWYSDVNVLFVARTLFDGLEMVWHHGGYVMLRSTKFT